MKYEKICALFQQHQKKTSYLRVWERRSPACGKTVPRRFLPHIIARLIIAVDFVAYTVE